MTDPVAAAIEALEPFAKRAQAFYGYADTRDAALPVINQTGRFTALKVSDFRRARNALASLRSLAHAKGESVENEWNKLAHDLVVNSTAMLASLHQANRHERPVAKMILQYETQLEALTDRWVELRQRGTPFDAVGQGDADLVNAVGLLFMDAMSVRCEPSSYAKRVIDLVRQAKGALPTVALALIVEG